jgi:hypothetical protein
LQKSGALGERPPPRTRFHRQKRFSFVTSRSGKNTSAARPPLAMAARMLHADARRSVRREHVPDVQADDLRQAQAGAQGEGDDRVVADVARGRAEDQALLVGRQRSRREVRHPHWVGEEVKAVIAFTSGRGR